MTAGLSHIHVLCRFCEEPHRAGASKKMPSPVPPLSKLKVEQVAYLRLFVDAVEHLAKLEALGRQLKNAALRDVQDLLSVGDGVFRGKAYCGYLFFYLLLVLHILYFYPHYTMPAVIQFHWHHNFFLLK